MALGQQALGLQAYIPDVAVLYSVDWLLGMVRTTVNVWGDANACVVVDAWAKRHAKKHDSSPLIVSLSTQVRWESTLLLSRSYHCLRGLIVHYFNQSEWQLCLHLSPDLQLYLTFKLENAWKRRHLEDILKDSLLTQVSVHFTFSYCPMCIRYRKRPHGIGKECSRNKQVKFQLTYLREKDALVDCEWFVGFSSLLLDWKTEILLRPLCRILEQQRRKVSVVNPVGSRHVLLSEY